MLKSNLVKLSKNPKLVEAAAKVIATKAAYKAVKERVDAYVAPIFASMKDSFPLGKYAKGPIESPKEIFLADLNSPEVKAYWDALQVAHKENGFNVPEGYCPALCAEHEHLEAKWDICDVAYSLCNELPTRDQATGTVERFDKYVETLVGLLLAGPKGSEVQKLSKKLVLSA